MYHSCQESRHIHVVGDRNDRSRSVGDMARMGDMARNPYIAMSSPGESCSQARAAAMMPIW